MSFIEYCIRRPVTVTVVVALIVIFGLISLTRVPVQLTPNVDQPVVTVTTTWFGASPSEIVREVIERQEDVLKSVAGLREMTSTADEGRAQIRLEFFVGVDKDAALNEVRDKLRQVPQYPEDVDEPTVEATDAFTRDYIAWFIVRPIPGFKPTGPVAPGFDGDITHLGDFLDDFVKPILERADGVSEVQLLGGRERELQVRVDMERLAARGITLDRLVQVLRAENVDVTAGTVDEGKRSTSVRVTGQYDDVDKVRTTIIAYTETGAPVYVHDVAEVVLDFKKEVGFVRSMGVNVIAINAQRETGSNVLTVMQNLKAAVEQVNRDVLGGKNWGIEVVQLYDQTVYIRDAVRQAGQNLLIGAALAGAVLFITLRSLGATLVVMVAIPISTIGTILGMNAFGRSLNVISLSGLAFAVGMGIDNAIVVLENIFRHREMGKDRVKAAIDGAREVWGAIVAATLTNVAVFLPIIFIEEEAGQLFRDISVALTIGFFFYLFVAPTVIPMLATLFLRRMPAGLREKTDVRGDTILGRLTAPVGLAELWVSNAFYRVSFWLTGGLLRRVLLIAVLVVASVALSLALMPPTDYLPPGNQNLVFGLLFPPPGYNIEEYRSMATQVVEPRLSPWWSAKQGSPEHVALQQQWRQQVDQVAIPRMQRQLEGMRAGMQAAGMPPREIESATASLAGRIAEMQNAPPPPAIDNFFFVNFGSFVFMGAASADRQVVKPLSYLMTGAIEGIPGTFGFFTQAPIFRIARQGSGLEVNVTGVSEEKVIAAASAVQMKLMEVFKGYVPSDPQNFNIGRDEVRIIPDRVRAAAAGLSSGDIRQAAQAAVDGLIAGEYREAGRSIDLTVLTNAGRIGRGREDLARLPIATPSGQVVPLESVATFANTSAPQTIRRSEEQPSVQFNVELPVGMTVGEATGIVESQVIAPLQQAGVLGSDANLRLAGSASKLQAFLAAFRPGFALAAVVTYLLLASLFESWLLPLTIILSVPFAMVGGFLALAGLHAFDAQYKLDVLTMLGFVILIGTIINNPILIVHQALNNLGYGMPRREAIARSTQTRVRPIFMSVVTSLAGMAPLVLVGGAGSELYRGLGTVLVGGLALSTFFTLFLTPTLMSVVLDVQALLRRTFHGRGREQASPRGAIEVEPEPATAAAG